MELLVVMAVLFVFSCLFLLAANAAKRKSGAVVCKSNLKQMGILLNDYLEAEGHFPLSVSRDRTVASRAQGANWTSSLQTAEGRRFLRYGRRTPDLFNCPLADGASGPAAAEVYVDYGYNADGVIASASDRPLGLGTGGSSVQTLSLPVKPFQVVHPAEMIAIGDSFTGWTSHLIDGRYDSIGLNRTRDAREGETARAFRRHARSGMYLFCDSRVERVGLDALYFSAATRFGRYWNRDNQAHVERLCARP